MRGTGGEMGCCVGKDGIIECIRLILVSNTSTPELPSEIVIIANRCRTEYGNISELFPE
jgi:hypothetical protein